jgi:hypothetical protein
MVVTKTPTNQYLIKLNYHEMNHAKMRLIQKEPMEAVIELMPNGDLIDVRYQESTEAAEVVDLIKNALHPDAAEDEKSKTINLKAIRDPKKRTKFFIELITNLYGHSYVDLKDLKVEYLEPEDADDLAETEDDESDSKKIPKKEEIKAKLKSVAMSGEGLLLSKEYHELVNSNFFLCRVVWIAEDETSATYRIKISAELGDPQEGTGFSYRVHGKWDKNDNGDFKKTIQSLKASEFPSINSAIEQSAFDAHATVMDEINTEEE